MSHKLSYSVIFGDTDAGGIVYHPRYLEMAERGRNEAGRSVGLDVGELFSQRQTGLALRRADMVFHTPALFDDRLTIHTHVEKLGAARALWMSRIQRGARSICTVRAEIICMNRVKHAPQMFPEDVRNAMQQLTLSARQKLPVASKEVYS
ncbi:hypothetical protein D8B22_17700 [Verminephrobacter aporrectodeae subsp. tuberculatae]|uniref:thioesterase family protein n=1 Tax=Verminephrobacter aporrectodeae TaxID=1110389 RepID=UPI000237826D|nr:thioesterase family protein [Verminephrobacter aporrectodeae]MCW8166670.1 hypothetical protein [Verminephrobacter aporrectodeae subsp. tuberculatae]MCW8170896.1 hypothetical protein [Verminephrobacter aporrectodeae subsp. tuberculatae]MCW8208668.1 hypothetical protein [Verminephrobacter aporrectodeae subsp. tuberculatae]